MKPKKERIMKYTIRWHVNPYRKDKRTGVVDQPAIRDRYAQMLWEEAENMFKDKK